MGALFAISKGNLKMENPLIKFLAAYGPTPDGNNMYDEFVVAAAGRAGLDALHIPEAHSKRIIQDLSSETPISTILTGTAGDGKTYTARQVLDELSDGSRAWANTESMVTISHKGRTIHFVKDMSELSDSEKATIIPSLIDACTAPAGTGDLYVICVNDGHLLKTWRDHAGGDPRAEKILEAFQVLLKDDRETQEGYQFRLVNMSRRSHANTLDEIIDAICEHEGWTACPSDCPGLDPVQRCPILVNREEFRKKGQATLRDRLKSLIEIAAADDEHLSIRQIMILVVNALLGDSKNVHVTPLLDCNRARIRAKNDERAETNPFNNIFGENHPLSRRQGYAAFATLARFGIGYETNNHFDDGLLAPHGTDGFPDHPIYGSRIFARARDDYTENPVTGIDALRTELVSQRRRLFFTTAEVPISGDREKAPWLLTIHHHGEMFTNLLRSEDARDADTYRWTRLRLIKGLNRALTGALTETNDKLWLTQPSGVYRGVDVPLLVGQPIGWKGSPYHLALVVPDVPGRPPRLELVSGTNRLVSLAITPTLFEYLLRVADGALPTSFSSQCFQDIRNFQIRCVGAIERLMDEYDNEIDYVAVETGEEKLALHSIGVLEEAE
jgi:hypothetical protein